MDPQTFFISLIQGIALLSLAVVTGGLVLEFLMVPALPAALRHRLRRAIRIAFALSTLATVGMIVLRIQAMGRVSVTDALLAFPEVIRETHVGMLLGVRLTGFALAGMIYEFTRGKSSRVLCLLISLGVAATFTLTSHAVAWGDLTSYTGADLLHVIAASVWIGGLIGLAIMIARPASADSAQALGGVIRGFSRVAALCLLTVVATGIYHSWAQLNSLSSLWTTPYGNWLVAKVLLVLTIVLLGAVNRFVFLPALQRDGSTQNFSFRLVRLLPVIFRGSAKLNKSRLTSASMLAAFIFWEAIISLGIFASTAALSQTTPAREILVERKKVSMYRPGGRQASRQTKSAIVTPPASDPGRGRTAFIKAQCHHCHAARGSELLPTPIARGPVLNHLRLKHPSFLMETLMKPHPAGKLGRESSDPRTLPAGADYRDKLTVQELLDLVAYLRTL